MHLKVKRKQERMAIGPFELAQRDHHMYVCASSSIAASITIKS